MSKPKHRPLYRRPYVTAERLITIGAVALTAFGFAQPQVLALAGFDFEKQHALAERATDPIATGSISVDPTPPRIHGLAGTLKPLRGRE